MCQRVSVVDTRGSFVGHIMSILKASRCMQKLCKTAVGLRLPLVTATQLSSTWKSSYKYNMRTLASAASALAEDYSSNPLLQQEELPQFDRIQAHHVQPAISCLLEDFYRNLTVLETDLANNIASSDNLTYEDVLERIEIMNAPLEFTWTTVQHLMGVMNSADFRAAHADVQRFVNAYITFFCDHADEMLFTIYIYFKSPSYNF